MTASRNEEQLESSAWHCAILKERTDAYATGQLATSDWGQAKKRIKNKAFVGKHR